MAYLVLPLIISGGQTCLKSLLRNETALHLANSVALGMRPSGVYLSTASGKFLDNSAGGEVGSRRGLGPMSETQIATFDATRAGAHLDRRCCRVAYGRWGSSLPSTVMSTMTGKKRIMIYGPKPDGTYVNRVYGGRTSMRTLRPCVQPSSARRPVRAATLRCPSGSLSA
jgi:hypothetical protein